MKNRERGVNFYDLSLKCSFRGLEATPIPLEVATALQMAKDFYSSSSAPGTRIFNAAGKQFTIEDWAQDTVRGEHHIVFSCADPNLSDVSFKDMASGASRMAGKAPNEAIDQSCHVLLKPAVGTAPALMLQTSGSGVSANRICTALNRLLRNAARLSTNKAHFRRSHPDGTVGKTLHLQAHFEIVGHQSNYLEAILRTGRLDGVELITEVNEDFDGEKGYMVTSRTIKLEVVDDSIAKSFSGLRKLFKQRKGDVPNKARVHYRESLTGSKKSHMFDANDLEKAFSKREIISFDTDIMGKYSSVSATVIDKMRELI